jgi:hypothetical protein
VLHVAHGVNRGVIRCCLLYKNVMG